MVYLDEVSADWQPNFSNVLAGKLPLANARCAADRDWRKIDCYPRMTGHEKPGQPLASPRPTGYAALPNYVSPDS